MRVAVIGGGVVGVTTAYFLAQNGHQVSVIEQRGNVSEEASHGHAGLTGASHLMPLTAPTLTRRLFSHYLKSHRPVNVHPSVNLLQWRWLRRWLHEGAAERLLANQKKLLLLGSYSQELLSALGKSHQLDFQQRGGILQIFRQDKKNKCHQAAVANLGLLRDANLPFQQLDEAGCHQLEPTLSKQIPLAGGLYFPEDKHGNCALFTKQLKVVAQQSGVEFIFSTCCESLVSSDRYVLLELKTASATSHRQFDAVVIASGANSLNLLKNSGIHLPLARFQSYSNTVNIKNNEDSPKLSIIDETEKVIITRMDKRIRIAGTFYLGKNKTNIDKRAWHSLRKSGEDWFPGAANFHTGQHWYGSHLMLPDGIPILGASPVKNIFVNLAHAEYGWSLATGSGKIVADLLSGNQADMDITGLTFDTREQ